MKADRQWQFERADALTEQIGIVVATLNEWLAEGTKLGLQFDIATSEPYWSMPSHVSVSVVFPLTPKPAATPNADDR